LFDGEFVRTAAGEIFTLVHQYNRIPEWDIRLKDRYGVVAPMAKPTVEKSRRRWRFTRSRSM
jgi:hypothetical protein